MQATTKKSISITLSSDILSFLQKQAPRSKSELIDKILHDYRKYTLQQELMEDARSDTDNVMEDFAEYLTIVNTHA